MTQTTVDVTSPPEEFDLDIETLIIGAGACGLVAALAALENGQQVLVVEADTTPSGSTALSAGLIPAAGTDFQRDAGIEDDPNLFATDIQSKAKGENDQALVDVLTKTSSTVIEWLAEKHKLPFLVVTDFDYPGHSRRRMHGLPSRAGSELIDALRNTCETHQIDIVCERRATRLFVENENIVGVSVLLPDGSKETIGCRKLILACNGFGGNRPLVEQYMPEIKDGLWFGHNSNQGEALYWGEALGAKLASLGAYQGHGNVAHPHGILITWAVITEGGIQVSRDGNRFWDESQGYSEAAQAVLAQPDGEAYTIFDSRIARIARQFEDFKQAEAVGAIQTGETIEELAEKLGLPADRLRTEVASISTQHTDQFGRSFGNKTLAPPYCGVRVTGALFHTQGGLCVNENAQVLRTDGTTINNLFAGGGAACGVSGKGDSGYLSGNGLLSAVVLGWIAGKAAVA